MTSPGLTTKNNVKALHDYQFIDIHYHASPDLYLRRFNALEAGNHYQALDGAVVLKSHLGATAVQATLAQRQGLPVFPSVVLNAIAGGISYRVIMQALAEYQPQIPSKLIVDFPTITGRKYRSKLTRQVCHEHFAEHTFVGETLFDNTYKLKKEVIDILKMAADFPIVLSTGHAAKEEIDCLIDACITYHVSALLLNQPANPLTNLPAMELKEIAKQDFVWIEQTALTYLLGHQTRDDFTEVLCCLPRVIYSSDLGQTNQMDIKTWLDYSTALFDEMNLSPERKEALWRRNALMLLSG
ncbi:DUF6282 family protein [Legionella maceachernii]|uniref:Amidohydrolase n=1 Tax=Legionella maceachernii TaxID=466 RepID=A0A0W0VZL0_9GAMM|nr:DUF6282 family protein [Legionella maceachernii]KTD25563.1 hypothetical protein Lmac_1927 [Legionella maceachernii]SJZ56247.1 hypothetical protein SAMN02745128_00413 [Legionella maceachernii]SUP00503.1 Uncharacterised protein [Legionella maceachernii]